MPHWQTPPRARAAGFTLDRRPLLLDILQAERDWGIRVLRMQLLHSPAPLAALAVPLSAPLCQPPGSETFTRFKFMGSQLASGMHQPPCCMLVLLSPRIFLLSQSGSVLYSTMMSASSAQSSPSSQLSDTILISLPQLAQKHSFALWQQQQDGGRVLQSCKLQPGRSVYIYLEPRSSAVMRARLRLGRSSLAASLFKRGLTASPLCSHPPCVRPVRKRRWTIC
jgi:hypothetical protein